VRDSAGVDRAGPKQPGKEGNRASHGVPVDRWIDEQRPPVPAGLRRHLTAGETAGEPVSASTLLAAAEAELRAYFRQDSGKRKAAYSLLSADAYLTFACLRVVQERRGGSGELRRIARKIGKMDLRCRT